MDLTYTGTKGTDLDILRAPNRAPLGTPSDEIQANRIDNNATGFTFDQSGANSIYNALQVRVVHRFTHGVMLQGIYTYGKSLDDASSIGGGSATVEQQDGNLHGEYGLSTFDVRHQFRAVSMWELPFGQRSRWANHGWKERVFGDWRLQNIFTWQTGTPFTVLLGGVASDNGTGANFSLRPNITGNPNTGICGGSPAAYFNTGVFALPTDANGNLTYGDEPRGAVEGPCSFNWNMSLAKTFRFGPGSAPHAESELADPESHQHRELQRHRHRPSLLRHDGNRVGDRQRRRNRLRRRQRSRLRIFAFWPRDQRSLDAHHGHAGPL